MKPTTRAESSPSFQSLSSRLDQIEKDVTAGRREDMLTVTKIAKTDLINSLVKAYDKNIKITGMTYDIKDSKNLDKKAYESWCVRIIRKALIETKVAKESDVIDTRDAEPRIQRGVISNLHPLGANNNAAIVVAFVEASFAQQVKDTVRKNRNLSMGKIKILVHLPPIIDCLHNEALRARKEEIEKGKKAGTERKIHCNISFQEPWVRLVEIVGSERKPLPFEVEDGRLVDPAGSLAILALSGKKFTPYKYLSKQEKEAIPSHVLKPANSE